MTSGNVWDRPELRPADGEWVSFLNPGDSVSGTLVKVDVWQYADGSAPPLLVVQTDDGETRQFTAGQKLLHKELAAKSPQPGDRITVTYTHTESRPGGKTLKHWDVAVQRKGDAPATAAFNPATPPPAPQQAPTQAQAAPVQPDIAGLQAMLGNLSPEQRATLGFGG